MQSPCSRILVVKTFTKSPLFWESLTLGAVFLCQTLDYMGTLVRRSLLGIFEIQVEATDMLGRMSRFFWKTLKPSRILYCTA